MKPGQSPFSGFIGWPLRIAWFLILFGILYFVGINLALNTSITRKLINEANPERLQVRWQKAWSLWPMDLHLQGVEASGRAGSNSWSFSATELSSALDVMGLLDRHLHITTARAQDPVFILEKHPQRQAESRSGKDGEEAPGSARRGWWIEVDEALITGDVIFSVPKLHGELRGQVATGLSYRTDTRELHLDDGRLDTEIETLLLNNGRKLVDRGRLEGSVSLGPYLVGDHPGKQMLRFLDVDAKVAFETDNLTFLDPWLSRFQDLSIDGAGQVEGELRISQARFQPGSRLSVEASELAMELFDFSVDGAGEVVLEASESATGTMEATVLFRQLAGYSRDRQALLIEGENLRVLATAPSNLLIDKSTLTDESSLALSIEKIAVPDIAVYQQFVPRSLPLVLKDGLGTLRGELVLDQQHFEGRVILSSDSATVGLQHFEVESGLEIVVQVAIASFADAEVDISGTAIRLSETSIAADPGKEGSGFTTSLEIDRGTLRLDRSRFIDGAAKWRQLIGDRDINAMLENAGTDLHLIGTVSNLDWINALIQNPYGLQVAGAGKLDVALLLDDGHIAPGSALTVTPENLRVNFLDYSVTGEGSIGLSIAGEAESPDLGIRLEVLDGQFGRKDETDSYIEVDQMLIEANAQQVGFATLANSRNSAMKMRLRMLAARVPDMADYNGYLPDSSPLRLTGGTAELSVDVTLEPTSASGTVALQTTGLGATIDDQQVAAELDVDIVLRGGVPADMAFDISGSTIVIDRVKVKGDAAAFGSNPVETEPWNVTLDLAQGKVRWKKPVEIDAELNLRMKDTLPLVAVLANDRGEYGWLEKLLTIEDVRGNAKLSVKDQRINVPYLMVEADDIRLGAKAAFEENRRAGVVYARYKKLHGLLKFAGANRNFDILKARKQFDEFDVFTATLMAVPPPDIADESGKSGKAANQITGDARSGEGNVTAVRSGESKPGTAKPLRDSGGPSRSAHRSKQWQPFEHIR